MTNDVRDDINDELLHDGAQFAGWNNDCYVFEDVTLDGCCVTLVYERDNCFTINFNKLIGIFVFVHRKLLNINDPIKLNCYVEDRKPLIVRDVHYRIRRDFSPRHKPLLYLYVAFLDARWGKQNVLTVTNLKRSVRHEFWRTRCGDL
jgi:hypothetical protein